MVDLNPIKKFFQFFPEFNRISLLNDIIRSVKLIKKSGCLFFSDRYELYDYLLKNFLKTPLIYLEFGVYKGDSFKWWLKNVKDENSSFYGFDSFKGLPENWRKLTSNIKKGTFCVSTPPDIHDKRSEFICGLFQQTLPRFLQNRNFDEKNNNIVIHLDADLYTSTAFVLHTLRNELKKGDILIFDEFTSGDEFRAFQEYVNIYYLDYRIIAASGKGFQAVGIILE